MPEVIVEMPLEEMNTHAVRPYGFFRYFWVRLLRRFYPNVQRVIETIEAKHAETVANLETKNKRLELERDKFKHESDAAKVELKIQTEMLARIQSRIMFETSQYKANGG